MLSSIHPLGERSRGNRWAVTVSAFTLGAMGAGGLLDAVLGRLGAGISSPWPIVAAALAAGVLDVVGVAPPGPSRQVNERWIDHYRGPVYGAGFGAQLGAGVATYVVTWGVYATAVAAAFSGSGAAGALVGTIFGLGRSLGPLASGWVDRPSRLTAFHLRLAELANPVHRFCGVALIAVALVAAVVAAV